MESKRFMRYIHCEGHLDVCYNHNGEYIITCGPDGDVRIYNGFEDDDPVSHRIGDAVYFIAFKGGKFYTASDDNTVSAYSFKEGEKEEVLARFTAHVTHFCFNDSGTILVAGASDFIMKIVDVDTKQQKVFSGHEAPVLSVALHPDETLVASSSCDGTVRIWTTDDQKVCKVITGLPKSNDFSTSKVLCRLAWDKTGKYLFVPMNKQVNAYDVKTWNVAFELTDTAVSELISVVSLSPCGQYIAGATRNGLVIVWRISDKKCVAKEKHDKGLTITGIAWHPQSTDIAYCDNRGYLGLMSNIVPADKSAGKAEVSEDLDLFDDADDGLLANAVDMDENESVDSDGAAGAIPGIDTDFDDEASMDQPIKDAAQTATTDSPDQVPTTGNEAVSETAVAVKKFEAPSLQKPFQSSSSPVSLTARYMVWNATGLIIQYNSDEEQSISVEFHDAATHHAIHVNNTLSHTMGDLSTSAVILACESSDDVPSQLVCMHFGSWDNCKEWSTSMPEGEDIQVICLGDDWIAVATNKRMVRIFSIGGTQMQLFTAPGPVVTMNGNGDMLFIVYHCGLGVPGDQCLAFQLISVRDKKKTMIVDRMPLSPKSTLTWIGFSKEGTPFSMDSAGVVRMLDHSFSNVWVEVANMRQHCKGKTDNMWLVGIHEHQQHIRAILCKGAKYPPVLPRPTVQLLSFQLPLCEISTDKTGLENTMWQSLLFSNCFSQWDSEGMYYDQSEKSKFDMAYQESLMKLFALACKSGQEFRATEICQLMPNSRTVQLAIKYAARLHLVQLAERLGDIAQKKAEDEEIRTKAVEYQSWSTAAQNDTRGARSKYGNGRRYEEDESDNDVEIDGRDREDGVESNEKANTSTSSHSTLLIRQEKKTEQPSKSLSNSQTAKRNPFKVVDAAHTATATTPVLARGTGIFDSMEKVKLGRTGKLTDNFSPDSASLKQKKNLSQGKLLNLGKKPVAAKPNNKNGDTVSFDAWFGSNKEQLAVDNGLAVDDSELMVIAVKKYRQFIKDANGSNAVSKRKRSQSNGSDVENDAKSAKETAASDHT